MCGLTRPALLSLHADSAIPRPPPARDEAQTSAQFIYSVLGVLLLLQLRGAHARERRGRPREGNNHYTHIYAHAQTVYRATASSARHASRARHAHARAHRGGAGCVRYQSAPPRGAGGGGGARGRARLTSCSHATEKVMSQVSELPFYTLKYDILLYRERPDGVSVWRKAKGGFGKTQLKDGSYFTGELKAFYM